MEMTTSRTQFGLSDVDWDTQRDKIFLSVIDANKNGELLRTVPHEDIADGLAIVARIMPSPGDDTLTTTTMMVTDRLLGLLKLTGAEVLDIAHKNQESVGYEIKPIREAVLDLMLATGVDKEYAHSILDGPQDPPMYVVTTTHLTDGASVLAMDSALDAVHKEIGDFLVLPSSRHEIIAIPSECVTEEDLPKITDIVHLVNQDINSWDYLSDTVYKYDGKTLSVAMEKERSITEEKMITEDKTMSHHRIM